jgi:hypothetical protein
VYKKGNFPGSGPLVSTLGTFAGRSTVHNFRAETHEHSRSMVLVVSVSAGTWIYVNVFCVCVCVCV